MHGAGQIASRKLETDRKRLRRRTSPSTRVKKCRSPIVKAMADLRHHARKYFGSGNTRWTGRISEKESGSGSLRNRVCRSFAPWADCNCRRLYVPKTCYQTRQELAGYMGSPFLQPNASPNFSKFCTSPFTRKRPGECGSVLASTWAYSGRVFSHHTCAYPKEVTLVLRVVVNLFALSTRTLLGQLRVQSEHRTRAGRRCPRCFPPSVR